ncbi:Acyl-CoA dehydrogenase family member 9, mitochondrial [Trichinella murrelli]|uniref:Acyl-CoA dehydrogenase family member 9, mitochondrial n=1 Tax=Trichinella murrelli TaxID=144512 RepID=A0A0V0TP71_9BILA|nr:Acyl-CoA dehydrogenase family member 9, mitochondrial [Trichinella murrelli]
MVYSRRIHQCIKSKLLMRNNFSLFIHNRNEYCLKSTKLEASNKTDIDVALFLDATETSSVAKGLFCDRVDKSMLIYPGFEETEDLTDVEKFAGRVRSILKKQCICSFVEWDKNRSETPEEVKFSFKKIGLYSMSVPQQYGIALLKINFEYEFWKESFSGGLNLNNKAKSQQKRTYLPMLAAGDVSGAFCLHEHACGQDIASMRTEIVENWHGAGFKLNGQKSWVTNGALADLLVVFAKVQSRNSDQRVFSDPSGHLSVFLVDWRKIEGLNNLIIPETAILGNESAGFHIAHSMVGNIRYSFSAVAQSYGRSLSESNFIRVIAVHFVDFLTGGKFLDILKVERLVNLAMHVYILETMAFYIAGHLDSDSSKDFTVEGSIAQLLSRKYLREGIVSVMEIFGASAATTDEEFERLLRDVTTFSSFMVEDENTDDWLVGHIATSGLTAWAQSRAIDLHKIGRPSDYPWHVVKSRWLSGDVYRGSFSFKHYLHEHLHPSLMDACRFIEEVMCKFDHIIRNQLKLKQKSLLAELLEAIA